MIFFFLDCDDKSDGLNCSASAPLIYSVTEVDTNAHVDRSNDANIEDHSTDGDSGEDRDTNQLPNGTDDNLELAGSHENQTLYALAAVAVIFLITTLALYLVLRYYQKKRTTYYL